MLILTSLESSSCKKNDRIVSSDIMLQGRIQVRLWGGGEFQLVELMYILGENKYEFGGTHLQQLIKERLHLI